MAYTYEPYSPEIYGGKMFLVTPDEGLPFMVSTANGESEVPALVEFHLNPPPQAPYAPQSQQPSAEATVMYDHENRLRALEGQPPLALQDFLSKMQP